MIHGRVSLMTKVLSVKGINTLNTCSSKASMTNSNGTRHLGNHYYYVKSLS